MYKILIISLKLNFSKTRLAFESFSRRMMAGQTQPEAFNNSGIQLIQAAEVSQPNKIIFKLKIKRNSCSFSSMAVNLWLRHFYNK